jgi:hypothetical protein
VALEVRIGELIVEMKSREETVTNYDWNAMKSSNYYIDYLKMKEAL